MSAPPAARPPLDGERLAADLARVAAWRLRVVEVTGSTNADLLAAAVAGEREGLVLVAERQTSGRGRLDRTWVSPPRAGLTFSVLLRPALTMSSRPLLLMLAAVEVAAATSSHTGVGVGLKWPNDLIVAERKVGGLLATATGTAIVLGVGLNVDTGPDELPADAPIRATSLAIERGSPVDRGDLLLAVLEALAGAYRRWLRHGADPEQVLGAYRAQCRTLGQPVRVVLPDGSVLVGEAVDVDRLGRLVVRSVGEDRAVGVGDVVHVRPAP